MEYITFIFALMLTSAQYFLGYVLTIGFRGKLPSKLHFEDSKSIVTIPFYWLFGLLVHLTSVFLFKSLGLSWPLAIFLIFIVLPFRTQCLVDALMILNRSLTKLIDIPFLLWLAIQCYLGVSLFSLENGISTPWVNNYGDLTFHLGMIHHFAFNGDFPPEYHLFVGETLSYPFYVNLWTSMLWWPFASLATLDVVFTFQWVLMWSCAYLLLTFGRARFLPWILLFGGGSYVAIVTQPDTYSWRLINEGFPWTTWLSTVWVTQRSALMGLTVCLAAASLVLNVPKFNDKSLWHICLAGLILGLSPLVHTHFFVVTTLFLGAYLFRDALLGVWLKRRNEGLINWSSIFEMASTQKFLALFVPTCLCVVFFPILLGKTGMTGLIAGWNVPAKPFDWHSVLASTMMWGKNALPWFVVFGIVWWQSKKHTSFLLLLGLFLLANFISLATWEWDQIKVFLAIFTVFLVLWRSSLQDVFSLPRGLLNALLAISLVVPGIYEAYRIWDSSPNYQVYSPRKVNMAKQIRDSTPDDAIIASPTDHNSAATLSGRSLFYGYPGTLASHQLPYKTREKIQVDLLNIRDCKNNDRIDIENCPTHVIWDDSGRKYWHRVRPNEGYTPVTTLKNNAIGVYKVE